MIDNFLKKKEFAKNEEDFTEFFEGEINPNANLASNDHNNNNDYSFEMKNETIQC